MTQNGTTAPDSVTYNVAAASGWQTGAVAVSTVGITLSNAAEVISSAIYDASDGQLVLTGLNFNTSAAIDVTKLTITGQGGAGAQVTLTAATTNPIPASATSATVVIAGTDKAAVNAILNQNGKTAPDLTTYNVATSSGWQSGAGVISTVSITVINAAEVISMATYYSSNGNLVLTGLNFNTSAAIDVTKLTIKGQGGSTVTLTSATTNPIPASAKSATVVIAGADKIAIDTILNKNGTSSLDLTTYSVAAASGWQSGAEAVSSGITVNNAAEVISMATYDASDGQLVLTGLNFNTSATIDVTKLTITGQGGAGAQITLTAATTNPTPASATSATVAIAGTDKTAVNAILNKNGTTASDSTTYNIAAALGWQTGAAAVSSGITVSNVAEVISSATYDASNGQLVLTGLNFNTSATIDVTKLTIKGQGGAGAQVTLTAATTNPTPVSTTSATVAIAGTDKTAVNAIMTQNGSTSSDSTTYNIAAASGWQTGTAGVSTVSITVSNVAEVISSATYNASSGNLVLTGLNFNTSSTIDVTKLTITGQGGAGAQITLTAATTNPTPVSTTSVTVAIAGTDKTAVNAILTQNGTTAPDSTTYNVAAASSWQTGSAAVSTVGIAVSNAAEVISSATYDASSGNLVLTGLNFNTAATIDVTKLAIKGQSGAGAQVTLTTATTNPTPVSSTSATIAIAGTDKTNVNAILTQNGTTAPDSITYNVATASGWQTGAASVSTVSITVSNAAEVISSATYDVSSGNLVLTGLNVNTSAQIDVTKLTIKGQGGLTATLTTATTNPIPASSTSATVAIAGADKAAVNAILTKNGTTAPDSTTYNIASASGWQTGAAAVSTVGITVSNAAEVISMATYDASSGNLVLTGLNFNTSATIDVTKLTITGQGGAGAQITLTSATTSPTPASNTSATVAIAGTDKTAVNAILTKNGTTAPDSTTYNVATASNWQTGAAAVSTVGIAVSNAAEVISMATYDASSGNLVLTGLNFNTAATIDVTKLAIKGQGGAGAQVTLTTATTNPTPVSSTSATIAIAGTDKTAVNAILTQNGTTAPDSTTYNVATALGWQTGAAAVSTVGIAVSNAAEVISSSTYDASSGNLVLTGLNFNTSATIDVTKLTIKGQGGAGAKVTLTAATSNPIPASTTSATVVIAGTDKTAVDAILTQNGTAAPDSTIYNVESASGWQTGAVTVSTAGIAVSNAAEVISGATYDASSGNLVLTGLNFNTSSTIDVTKLTIIGQGGAGAQVTLTSETTNPTPASSTSATVAIAGTDKTAVNVILTQNGITAPDSTTYNVAAASSWQTGAASVSTVGITVSNAAEVISMAIYNASTGNLVLTGLNFNTSATIDVTKITIKGQGGAGAQVVLTAATTNPYPASSTSTTVAIAGIDKTAVNAILNKNGTTAPDSTTYNVTTASGWQTGAAAVSIVGIAVSNAAEVISMATYDASTGNLVLTGLNFNTSATIDVTKLTIKDKVEQVLKLY